MYFDPTEPYPFFKQLLEKKDLNYEQLVKDSNELFDREPYVKGKMDDYKKCLERAGALCSAFSFDQEFKSRIELLEWSLKDFEYLEKNYPERTSKDYLFFLRRGDLYRQKKDLEKAISDTIRGCELNPRLYCANLAYVIKDLFYLKKLDKVREKIKDYIECTRKRIKIRIADGLDKTELEKLEEEFGLDRALKVEKEVELVELLHLKKFDESKQKIAEFVEQSEKRLEEEITRGATEEQIGRRKEMIATAKIRFQEKLENALKGNLDYEIDWTGVW